MPHGTHPPGHIGQGDEFRVAIPDALFKIVVKDSGDSKKPDVLAFIYPQVGPNDNGKAPYPHQNYWVPVDEIEKMTGLDFFTTLTKAQQKKIEKQKQKWLWKVEKKSFKTACKKHEQRKLPPEAYRVSKCLTIGIPTNKAIIGQRQMRKITAKHEVLKRGDRIRFRKFSHDCYDKFKLRLTLLNPPTTISHVEHELHPTFRNSIRTSRDRSAGFPIEFWIWSEFEIIITAHFNDGHDEGVAYNLKYSADLPPDNTAYYDEVPSSFEEAR